ncbi:MAG: hypothetical protein U0704_16115 [Candidatus Eisenbacteria bacterium]
MKRLRAIGVRMAHGPLAEKALREACDARFGHEQPSAHTGVLRRRSDDPTLGDVCVLLADLAGPLREVELREGTPGRSRPAKVAKRKHAKPRRAVAAKQAKRTRSRSTPR